MDTDTEAEQVTNAIGAHRAQIDLIDQEIKRLIMLRSMRSKEIVNLRMGIGGTRRALSREREVIANYQLSFGYEGAVLAEYILKISREW